MNIYHFFTPIYLPDIKQKTAIQIDFEQDDRTVTFKLSGASANATFREYDGSLHHLYFFGTNTPAGIMTELNNAFDLRFLSEGDFLNFYETEGPFEDYVQRKMGNYFL